MTVTIDQLIAKLQEARAICGGDAEVHFWRDCDHHYHFTTGAFGFDAPIKNKISDDRKHVGFEIDSDPED